MCPRELAGTHTFTGRVWHPLIPDLIQDVCQREVGVGVVAEFSFFLFWEKNE